ncbi:hypothetical protein [Halalkalicoccus jeotgali]|uniref:DUF7993 domain-containing protein n=1 Tax=Halalkalicoccus jeotgali (strain DSM 18796 / CECT 7217 / JCM 14584 / KCTC 4019 / B3) TaxID=795797 RepID=D8J8Q3_HALJB|nr:hypothetical protein [Halalkalicoccus jeotgali]ADJ14238.1 hypothetical protein HacjB3_04235 [Halalkalicoccus jeotgali B3]ELY40500.1 hypothetical protein C497_02597 [Halalkalicoccus jeotgali B3]
MVEEHLADGRRIAQLLASEIDGRTDGSLDTLSVTEANPDVEPTANGAFAYAVAADGERLAGVYVHPDRVHLEFDAGHEAALTAAESATLRVRPKATHPPKTLVFVEDGAAVKRAVAVIESAAQSN